MTDYDVISKKRMQMSTPGSLFWAWLLPFKCYVYYSWNPYIHVLMSIFTY